MPCEIKLWSGKSIETGTFLARVLGLLGRGLRHSMEGGGEGEGVARDRQRLLVVREDLPGSTNRVMTNGLLRFKVCGDQQRL